MPLRDYQDDAVESVIEEIKTAKSTAVVMPTGTGKTVVMAHIIRKLGCRAMVLAHREELIFQAQLTIRNFTGIESAIEMADLVAEETLFDQAKVIISTVQTQNARRGDARRMRKFKPNEFGLLIIDEMHHATADTYRNAINYYQQNPNLRLVGFTATPDRADEESLGQVFETVAYDYEILDAIQDGWLVPVEQLSVYVQNLDYSHLRVTAGDLNGADLAKVMEVEECVQGYTGSAIGIIKERRAIVFTVSVAQAELMANVFNRYREGMAAWVCGETKKEDRHKLLEAFKNGDIQVMCNCGVLTEGFDDPGVEVIIMARPTLSRSLYAQMCGRSLRPLPGVVDGLDTPEDRRAIISQSPKPSALIVDFVGNSGKHKLVNTADILGGKVSDDALERAQRLAEQLGRAGRPVNMVELLEESERITKEEIEMMKAAEEARKAQLLAKVKYAAKPVNPFNVRQIEPVRERGWDAGKQLTERQRGVLRRNGIDPDSVPYNQARAIIREIFRVRDEGPCTEGQAKVLQRYGYKTETMTFKEAFSTLDALQNNGWYPLEEGEPHE